MHYIMLGNDNAQFELDFNLLITVQLKTHPRTNIIRFIHCFKIKPADLIQSITNFR